MPDQLARLADAHHGIFTLDDVHRAGLTPDAVAGRVRDGRYQRVARATYRVVGASPTWRQAVMVVVGAGGPGCAASHRTALALHRIGRPSPTIDVVTPRRRRLRHPDHEVRVHTAVILPTEDLTEVTGIPTTSVERSLLDVAGIHHPDALAAAVDAAIAAGLTSAEALADLLARRRRRGRPGVRALEAVLSRPWLGVAASRYERALLELLADAGMEGIPQYEIRDGGEFVARVDIAFPEQRVAVEVDGHAYHASREQRAADATRQNRIHASGWAVVRCTSDQVFVRDPAIVADLRRLLRRRGRTTPPYL